MNKTSGSQDFIHIEEKNGQYLMLLSGDWDIYHVPLIEQAVEQTVLGLNDKDLTVDATGIGKLDTSGAWLLKKLSEKTEARVELSPQQKKLLEYLPHPSDDPIPLPEHLGFFSTLGKKTLSGLSFCYDLLVFMGHVAMRFFLNISRPHHFRLPAIVRHIDETGVKALPIIGLLAFLISMVISYQAAIQLQKFGADLFTIDLTVISLLREMGVLVTAILVAGRSGSAFAAEIGVMKLREEVDALKTIGLDPIEVLVLPRVIALMLVLPLLTFFADIIGLAGGSVMSLFYLDISLHQYIARVDYVANFNMFFVGIVKAPVFAFLIAIIGTYQGMSVTGSAESVGRLTTVAVVQSIFLVIMADAFFSIVFAKIGI